MRDDTRISADQAALDAAANDFGDWAQQFSNTATPLGSAYDQLQAGAGSLWGELSTASAQFLLGWNEALDTCRETAGIIAGNVGNYWVDLADVDVDTQITIDLTPQGD